MKNCKKIISIILTMCMVLQILPVFAENTKSNAQPQIVYLLNEQYGEGDTGSWTLGGNKNGATLTSEVVSGEAGNYAVKYKPTDTRFNVYASVPVLNAKFSENKEIVVKTRVMHTGTSTGSNDLRLMFKYNREAYGNNEAGNNAGLLFRLDKAGLRLVSDVTNGAWNHGAFYTKKAFPAYSNAWFDVEIRFTDDDTAKLIMKSGDVTIEENLVMTTGKADALNDLFMRADTGNTVSVDYLKVYEVYKKGEMSVDGSYVPGEEIKVGFDIPVNSIFTNVQEAVKLYDASGKVVKTSATLNENDNTVILVPENDITEDEYYTVKVDESKLTENCAASFASKRFYASKTKYLVYDEYAEGDTGSWTLGGNKNGATLTSEAVSGETGNYAMKYKPTDTRINVYASVPGLNAKFSENKEIVVKTRVMHTGTSTGSNDLRLMFKYNREAYGDNEAGNNAGLLFRIDKAGLRLVSDVTNGAWNHSAFYTKKAFPAYSNAWFDVEIRFTDDDTAKLIMKSGDVTIEENLVMTTGKADALNNLFMRADTGNTVSVDYLKVYEVYKSKMEIDGSYAAGEGIKVGFDIPLNSAFTDAKEALKLCDASGNVVKASAITDTEDNTVTLIPENDITEGEYYTVEIDETKLTGNCVFEIKQKQFYASKMKYIIYDDFENGKLGNWTLGKTTVSSNNYEYGVKDGAMYLNLKVANMTPDIPTLINDFKNVAYEKGKKIVVKAKVKSTGSNGNHRTYLKLNRPDNPKLPANEQNTQWYAIGTLRGDGYQVTDPNSHTAGQWVYQTSSGNIKNQWLEVETVLDGVNASAVTTVNYNGTKYGPKTGTLKENTTDYAGAYEAAGVDPKVGFTSFDSLTWVPRSANGETSGHEMAIDYIYAYELAPVSQLLVKDVVDVDEDIVVKLDKNIYSVADGAVLLKDSEGALVQGVTVSTDKNTITLHHDGELAEGKYKLVFGDSQSTGVIFETAELNITVAKNETERFIINQQFNTSGNAEGWVYAPTTGGLYNATVSQTTKGDYGVLMIKAADNMLTGTENGLSAAHFELKDDVVFNETGSIRIKTRFYHEIPLAATNSRVSFKYNRPFALIDQDSVEAAHNLGMLFIEHTGSLKVKDGQWDGAQDASKDILANAANKWLDFEMTLDFVNNSAMYSVKETGTEAEPVTATGTLKTKNAADALESLAVLFRGTPSTLYFDYITVAEVVEAKAAIDAKNVAVNANIGAHLIGTNGEISDFSDAVALYDAEGNEIEVTKSFVKENKSTFDSKRDVKVVLNPADNLEVGESYKVEFDEEKISETGLTLIGDKQFTFNVISSNDVDIDFEDSNITSWSFREDTLGNIKTADVITDDESGNKFLRVNVDGAVATGDGKLVTYEKTFDKPFVRNMEGKTVVEMKIRTNKNDARKYVKLNYPTAAGASAGNKTENLYNEFSWNTRLAAVMNNNNIGTTYQDYYFATFESEYANYYQGNVQNVATYETGEWYTVKTVYNNATETASTYVYDEENKLIDSSENNKLSAWWYGYADFNRTKPEIMHTIDSISLQFRPGNSVTSLSDEQFDIDNIRIYNEANLKAELTVNGNSISTFNAGEIVKPRFTLYPGDVTDTSYVVISAMYVGGILEDIHIKEITTSGEFYVEEEGYTVPYKENVVIKAFIWDSLDTMRPVGKMAKAADKTALYVDAYKGNDNTGSGDVNSPVASLDKALEIASTVNSEETGRVEIVVNDGTYHLDKSVSVNNKNHVTDELVIKAADGANPTFVNGITFKISDAVKVTDTNVTSRLVDQNAAGNLYELDLTKKVVLDDIPGVSLPGAYSYNISWVEESKTATSEMFFDGKPMTIARYPNESEGYTTVSKVVNRGAVPRNWEADRVGTDEYVEPANQNKDDVFVIESAKAADWTQADQALMFGYWEYDWATQTVPLKKAENGQLTAKYPSYYGVTAGQRYYVFNLLEEIDVPGEYFIDRNTGKMYFYMPENAKNDDEIIMSLSQGSMLDITADNTVIDGLLFTASRGKGITVSASNVTVKNSTISNTADMAIEIEGQNNTVENCIIHHVNGGIKVNGGSNADFTPGKNIVLNNDISSFARLSKVYTYAIELQGCGNTASNNNIYNSEHSALTFSGTNHTISFNDIHDVCKEVNDAGAIYVGRTWVSRDNEITNNYIHDIKSSAPQDEPISGVFFDDHFAGIIIKNNIFANIEGYGARGNKGRESNIANNIFVNCSSGSVKISSEYFPSKESYAKQISTVTPYLTNDLWKSKYEILFTSDKTAVNTSELIKGNYNKCINNLLINSGNKVEIPGNILATGNESSGNTTSSDPGFADMNNGDFRIDNSIIQNLIPGFIDVQFEKMGRK